MPRCFQQKRLPRQPPIGSFTLRFWRNRWQWRSLWIRMTTFYFQVPILLFQRVILISQWLTFHSKSNSTRECPGVSNKKGCLGSPNWFFFASLLKKSLAVEKSLNTDEVWGPFTFKCRSCSFTGESFSFKGWPFTQIRILRAKAQAFPITMTTVVT